MKTIERKGKSTSTIIAAFMKEFNYSLEAKAAFSNFSAENPPK